MVKYRASPPCRLNVFGGFQWARVVSPFKLLTEDDPVYAWRETLLDAFDGMARKSPGYSL
jgi:hypothetical protein